MNFLQRFHISFFCFLLIFIGIVSPYYYLAAEKTLEKNRAVFTENKGQIKDQNSKPTPNVLFSGSIDRLIYHIKNNGISYQQYRIGNSKEIDTEFKENKTKSTYQTTIYRTDVYWENINTNYTIKKEKVLPGYNNYYNVPEGISPALYVKEYESIWLKNIYKGIDMHYYGANTSLKYDFVIAPQADFRQIKLRIEGAKIKLKKDGSVQFITPLGVIEEGKPIAYQGNKSIAAKWVLNGNFLSIEIGKYNKNKPLVIDPPVREWATYYGGPGYEENEHCTVDNDGNVYITGWTRASTAIATTGAHQTVYGGGMAAFSDAFLAKFNTDGVRQWGTYYGGTGNEKGEHCSTDNDGNIYLAGLSGSSTNIATPGAHQTSFSGPTEFITEAFLVKFNSNGIRQWGTYYGGTGRDEGHSCATDNNGNIYLAGRTQSTSNMTSSGAHQTNFGGSTYDAFLVKFNTDGVRQWGTYYGDLENDESFDCATDNNGNVYLVGRTGSTNSIATAGAHQPTLIDPSSSFIVKFNTNGIRQWGTYYGAADRTRCAADHLGNVYLMGGSTPSSSTNISTLGAHQTTYGGGSSDAFLAKFDTNGVRQWSSYYGGSNQDYGEDLTIDIYGNTYLAGFTSSPTNIATPGTHQSTISSGSDAFLVKFNSNGVRQWGTYFGNGGRDDGFGCAVDNSGNIYLSGVTSSVNSITTPNAHQVNYGGSSGDVFLVKLSPPDTTGEDLKIICSGDSIFLAGAYQKTAGSYIDTLIGMSASGSDSIVITTLTINEFNFEVNSTNATCNGVCDGAATISVIGGISPYTYNWSLGDTTQNVSNLCAGNYSVIVSDSIGCSNIDTIFITDTIECVDLTEEIYGIYLPNSLTPNGDGINDKLFIKGFGILETDFTIQIFDRWGNNIYESHDQQESWDGKYKGELVENGVYPFVLKFKDLNGEIHSKIGHVNVLQ